MRYIFLIFSILFIYMLQGCDNNSISPSSSYQGTWYIQLDTRNFSSSQHSQRSFLVAADGSYKTDTLRGIINTGGVDNFFITGSFSSTGNISGSIKKLSDSIEVGVISTRLTNSRAIDTVASSYLMNPVITITNTQP